MRGVLALWLAPAVAVVCWYTLSAADVGQSLGSVYLSRDFREGVFLVAGHILGVAPERLPAMVASGFLLDTAILLAILGLRHRRAVAAFAAGLAASLRLSRAAPPADPAPPAE
ncbi:DUF6105 family protein [Jiella sonneratiae]|uniref:Uncharacterized protein n=1 Tax=Jiella sonneratiae TaxID=2816856 RepID=A0ABS3IZ77_9HYPH|nr:DUF6105 family protein [Jiella sonneratiae]MBO0902731.1 hypothetical protein [Jiella sonneratiae]